MFLLVAESLPGASKQGYSLGPVIYTEATQQLQVAIPPLRHPPRTILHRTALSAGVRAW